MNKKLLSLSKSELIQLIDILSKRDPFFERNISRAINDLEYEKVKKRIDDAEEIATQSHTKWEKALELLAPYDGWRICDIPDEILSAASKLQKDACELDRKFCRMLKIEEKSC